jgi:hypothetical protein
MYVEANGVVAWVPEKLTKREGDDVRRPAWLELKQAKNYRVAYRYLQLPQQQFEELEEIGFAWCRNEEKWEKEVVPALMTYKQLRGNLLVTGLFVVPRSKPWPKHLWGMKLGKTVDNIRSIQHFVRGDPERRQWLDSIGFEWDDLKRQWDSVQEALDTYWQVHGDLAVTQSFVVPSCSPWSKNLWGMALGKTVSGIRTKGNFAEGHPQRRQWLEDMGFEFDIAVYDNTKNDQRWVKEVAPALMTYKQLRGNLLVTRLFEVPRSKPWPKQFYGMKLGKMVNAIRSTAAFVRGNPERRQWLDSIGFEWDDLKRQWKSVQEALITYWQQHGDLAVAQRFVVPACSPWSENLWGMTLGTTVDSIRSKGVFLGGHPERRQWLEDMGFLFKVRPSSAAQVRLAAAHYGRPRVGAVAKAVTAAPEPRAGRW